MFGLCLGEQLFENVFCSDIFRLGIQNTNLGYEAWWSISERLALKEEEQVTWEYSYVSIWKSYGHVLNEILLKTRDIWIKVD